MFADKLSIPTSMAFAHGGVIVHQAAVTLFLKDTDGMSYYHIDEHLQEFVFSKASIA